MNIYDFALKMEQDGSIHYKNAAQQCNDEWLKGIFEFLSLEEEKHFNIFTNLKNKNMNLDFKSESSMGEYKSIFHDKMESEVLSSISKMQVDIYKVAAEDEKSSIALYEDMLQKVESEEEKVLLLEIIKEEKRHLKFMEEIIELMNKLEATKQ